MEGLGLFNSLVRVSLRQFFQVYGIFFEVESVLTVTKKYIDMFFCCYAATQLALQLHQEGNMWCAVIAKPGSGRLEGTGPKVNPSPGYP